MNTSHDTSISVVITCFNQEAVIGRAIHSVLSQSPDTVLLEVIVVDDGSTDGSASVLAGISERDPRVVVLRQENAMVSAARNRGISASCGSHVAFLDGDDEWLPGRLAALVAAIDCTPEAGLHYCDFLTYRVDGSLHWPTIRAVSERDIDVAEEIFVRGISILPSCAVIRSDVLHHVGGFDPAMAYNEEAEMWVRIALQFPIQHHPGRLVIRYESEGTMSGRPDRRSQAQHRTTAKLIELEPRLRILVPARLGALAYRRGVAEMREHNLPAARQWFAYSASISSPLRFRAALRWLSSVRGNTVRVPSGETDSSTPDRFPAS